MRRYNKTIHLSLLVAICLSFTTGTMAHPGDGLIIEKNEVIYFGWVHPFVSNGHAACIWKLDSQERPHQFFKSDHSTRDAQSSNIWVSLGLDGHIYCLQRQYLGEEKGQDLFVSELWRLESDGIKARIFGPEYGRSPLGNNAFVVDRDGTVIHVTSSHVLHKRNL